MNVIQQGEMVAYTDADGRRLPARVDYVWERSDGTLDPLVNLSFVHDGDERRTVATSVPHHREVAGASGYYWERRTGHTHRLSFRGEPGDRIELTNLADGYITTYRVQEPPPGYRKEEA